MLHRFGKGHVAFSVAHFLVFVLGITIISLYATDIQRWREEGSVVDSQWVFAVIVGSLSCISCILYSLPWVFDRLGPVFPAWNLVLFILNIALFGVFAKIFLHANPINGVMVRMKNAVWVDLASALVWFLVFLASLAYWWKHRHLRTRFTGRATV